MDKLTGKSMAKIQAHTPPTGTLRPCQEQSKNWDTTQNLYIEGNNLEMLKLLQKSYYKDVKMIYDKLTRYIRYQTNILPMDESEEANFALLAVCLDSDMDLDVVHGIAKLKKEFGAKTMRVVFRDSCFDDTVVKTNTYCILKDNGADWIECI